jgi:hypothetical protein
MVHGGDWRGSEEVVETRVRRSEGDEEEAVDGGERTGCTEGGESMGRGTSGSG